MATDRTPGVPASHVAPGTVPVPTMADLHAKGLATAVAWSDKKPTKFTPTPEGQALVYAAMRTNAELAIAHREGTR